MKNLTINLDNPAFKTYFQKGFKNLSPNAQEVMTQRNEFIEECNQNESCPKDFIDSFFLISMFAIFSWDLEGFSFDLKDLKKLFKSPESAVESYVAVCGSDFFKGWTNQQVA